MKFFMGFLIAILIVVVAVVFFSWGYVPGYISKKLTEEMRVPVTISKIWLGPRSIDVSNLQIGNPTGYTTVPKAFSADSIDIQAPLTRYFGHEIVIEELHIDNIYLGLEFDTPKGTSGNWTTIMSNLQSSSGGGQPVKKGEGRSIFIRKVVLTNISTDVAYRQDGGGVKHLPKIDRIELYNISSSGKGLADQLANSVLGQMLKQIFVKQNMQNMLQDLLNPEQGPLNQLNPFKKFLP